MRQTQSIITSHDNIYFSNSRAIQSRVFSDDGREPYATDEFSSEKQLVEAAKVWLILCENAPINKVNSIYYILAIPDT